MQDSTNFDLKIYEGSDKFNPLTVENANIEAIDEIMYNNQQASVTLASEVKTGTVHAITRSVDTPLFRFVATGDYETGDTVTVDGTPVTVKTPEGAALPGGAYVINSNVLCCLVGSLLTVYAGGASTASNALRLGGELPAYYAKQSDMTTVTTTADNASTLVNSLNSKLSNLPSGVLQAGQTSLTIIDISISATGLIDIYTDIYGVNPSAVSVSNGSITITFPAQASNMTVKVRCL